MSTTVCSKPCKYRKAVFCGRDFIMLNQFGMCDIWFDKNGQMRMVPNYPAEPEQKPPQQEKSEGSNTSENIGEKDEKSVNTNEESSETTRE